MVHVVTKSWTQLKPLRRHARTAGISSDWGGAQSGLLASPGLWGNWACSGVLTVVMGI